MKCERCRKEKDACECRDDAWALSCALLARVQTERGCYAPGQKEFGHPCDQGCLCADKMLDEMEEGRKMVAALDAG